jgi:hypothetical protein
MIAISTDRYTQNSVLSAAARHQQLARRRARERKKEETMRHNKFSAHQTQYHACTRLGLR